MDETKMRRAEADVDNRRTEESTFRAAQIMNAPRGFGFEAGKLEQFL